MHKTHATTNKSSVVDCLQTIVEIFSKADGPQNQSHFTITTTATLRNRNNGKNLFFPA